MPRARSGAAVLPPPMTTSDPLGTDALDVGALSYTDILRQAGAYRDPYKGVVHRMPFGVPFQRGGRWVQQTKVFPVAMSAEEARAKTRATGERWDWYSPGSRCGRCNEPIVGWCLGGRKFAVEHDHVTDFDPTLYDEVEVAAPDAADEGAVADEAPLLVEA